MNEQTRRTVASYPTYQEAERAVDYLSDQRFPVERVSIVGHDVKLVEQITGRMNYGSAALRGAVSGALTGVLIGWIFGLFDWIHPLLTGLALALNGLWFGAVVGAVFGLLMHAMQGGRRDFSSVSMMQPSRYEILVDAEVADEAAALLDRMPRERLAEDTAPGRRPGVSASGTQGRRGGAAPI